MDLATALKETGVAVHTRGGAMKEQMLCVWLGGKVEVVDEMPRRAKPICAGNQKILAAIIQEFCLDAEENGVALKYIPSIHNAETENKKERALGMLRRKIGLKYPDVELLNWFAPGIMIGSTPKRTVDADGRWA